MVCGSEEVFVNLTEWAKWLKNNPDTDELRLVSRDIRKIAEAYLRHREVLEWYAADGNYLRGMPGKRLSADEARREGSTLGIPIWSQDNGQRARKVLEQTE